MTTHTFAQADFVIITALEKEAQAVVNRIENHRIERSEEKDIRTYHCGTVPLQNRKGEYRVVVVLLPSMGETSAANATTDALVHWNPRFVLLVGIAGGVPQDDLGLGDVVVADQVYGYEYGKETDQGFIPRHRVYPVGTLLLERIRNFWDESWSKQVGIPRPANTKRAFSKHFIGSIASGNKVIASIGVRQQLLKTWPKLLAVEMEAEGFFAAVNQRPITQQAIVIRGISDLADEYKGDDWQEYAANAAAAFVISFLKSGPVEPFAGSDKISKSQDPVKISTAKLPSTDANIFGRERELAALDAAWENQHINIVSLVAWGGVGKTALVNRWLLQFGQDKYRGAECVYGWSFYSQGAAEGRQVSADPFINAALKWFGDPNPTYGLPWEKGERLAELVKQRRTLLVLDGLEPLQNPLAVEFGKIKDPGLRSLLRELARQNSGLVIVTTRLPVDDLKDFTGDTTVQIDLENLSNKAGAIYLKHLGVKGTLAEAEEATSEYRGHAMALTLLGCYLTDVYAGDIRKRVLIRQLADEEEKGPHARRIMDAYEKWFAGKPEQNILLMLGLFDRPAEKETIVALLADPPISGLTTALHGLSPHKWQLALKHLRKARLLAERDPNDPDTLDCHPLVREHFGEKLRLNNSQAWEEAHSRLFRYFQTVPENTYGKFLPDTLEAMEPLYRSLGHACLSGLYDVALEQVYLPRILQGDRYYSLYEFSAFGIELASLTGFFDKPWSTVSQQLSHGGRAVVLRQTGYCLRALGWLTESLGCLQSAMKDHKESLNWKEAANDAIILSNNYVFVGQLQEALNCIEDGITCADLSANRDLQSKTRLMHGAVLHHMGNLQTAELSFRESEAIYAELGNCPVLDGQWSYGYNDLLLDLGEYEEVIHRVHKSSSWWSQENRRQGHYGKACDLLGLGRAEMLLKRDIEKARLDIAHAVENFRQAGRNDHLIRALLARSYFYRLNDTSNLEQAWKDVDEAMTLCARGGIKFHEADCHLEYAWLHLAFGNPQEAHKSFTQAHKMIEEMGYHRRDKEVLELGARL